MMQATSPAADPGQEHEHEQDEGAELRAEIARQMVPLYVLAPRVGLHPLNLGGALRGKRPLTPDLAARIRAALAEMRAEAEAG